MVLSMVYKKAFPKTAETQSFRRTKPLGLRPEGSFRNSNKEDFWSEVFITCYCQETKTLSHVLGLYWVALSQRNKLTLLFLSISDVFQPPPQPKMAETPANYWLIRSHGISWRKVFAFWWPRSCKCEFEDVLTNRWFFLDFLLSMLHL